MVSFSFRITPMLQIKTSALISSLVSWSIILLIPALKSLINPLHFSFPEIPYFLIDSTYFCKEREWYSKCKCTRFSYLSILCSLIKLVGLISLKILAFCLKRAISSSVRFYLRTKTKVFSLGLSKPNGYALWYRWITSTMNWLYASKIIFHVISN